MEQSNSFLCPSLLLKGQRSKVYVFSSAQQDQLHNYIFRTTLKIPCNKHKAQQLRQHYLRMFINKNEYRKGSKSMSTNYKSPNILTNIAQNCTKIKILQETPNCTTSIVQFNNCNYMWFVDLMGAALD